MTIDVVFASAIAIHRRRLVLHAMKELTSQCEKSLDVFINSFYPEVAVVTFEAFPKLETVSEDFVSHMAEKAVWEMIVKNLNLSLEDHPWTTVPDAGKATTAQDLGKHLRTQESVSKMPDPIDINKTDATTEQELVQNQPCLLSWVYVISVAVNVVVTVVVVMILELAGVRGGTCDTSTVPIARS
ncbi:hypothetical protein F4803DRAFT_555910 [Xylaria telfairii]|nr:hypothetical protein F4803DRAFT_555910 [Xylaria telfairii]